MLILLPPSEGKSAPKRGKPVDLAAISLPALTAARSELLNALVRLCTDQPDAAAKVLGLGPSQADEVARNANLTQAPAAPARSIYTGVLYDALGTTTLSKAAANRASRRILVISGLWGALRLTDRIPAYRLGGGVTLPGIGTLAAHWRPALSEVIPDAAGRGLVVDLRSGTYESFWRPDADLAARTVKVRVLHERDGKRTVVSHHNKATKGYLVRGLLENGHDPRTPASFADLVGELGWKAELTEPARRDRPWTVDVVVTEVLTQ